MRIWYNLRQVAEMGPDWQVSYTDLAYQERQNEGQIAWMLLLSVVMAYLFLVGQYENWTVPVPVMLCVVISLCGGLLGIKLSGVAMNIYCQLGVLMLIGVLPLLFATGAGANSRHAVGVATFWGMLTVTLVGMLFVPPLYVFFRRLAGVKG